MRNLLTKQVQAAQEGNTAAFEALVHHYQDKAFAVALGFLGDYHLAQDAAQEAFIEAYLRLPQLAASEAFWAWLVQIIRGKCARVIRTGKSAPARANLTEATRLISDAPGPEAVAVEADARELISDALRLLSDQERHALLLCVVGGLSYREIADVLQLSLPLVKKRLYTARVRLRTSEKLKLLRPSEKVLLSDRVRAQTKRHLCQIKETPQMQTALHVELVGPGKEHKATIKNLYTFYRYDLMPFIDGELMLPDEVTEETWVSGAWVNQHGVINGLHSQTHDAAVDGEDVFWEWPNLQAFLITANGWPAGFALVASPPNATPGVDYRLQEFFVVNKVRRRGVATEAARQLFTRLPGKWELAYDPQNLAALAFWKKLIPQISGGSYHDQLLYVGGPQDLPGYNFIVSANVSSQHLRRRSQEW